MIYIEIDYLSTVPHLGPQRQTRRNPAIPPNAMPPSHGPARIAYLLQMADISAENGISKKILNQLLAWRAAGHDCRWFQLNPEDEIWPPLSELPHHAPQRGNGIQRIQASRSLCRSIAGWQPNLIYFRYAYHAPGLPALFSRIPTVAEINSDDQLEYPLTLGPIKNLYHRLTRSRVLSTIRGFVPVTHELARVAAPFSLPSRVIANSVALASLSSLPPAPASAPPRLVFIGTARTPWHGLDRIAELACLFPDWGFDIVGDDSSIWPSISSGPAPENLVFHGTLPRERYLPLLAAATATLGTFGLYRKGMHEACPLKVREYLAHGLPVIGACADTDIPDGADYYLRLPNDSAPLAPHREAIAAFVARWRHQRVPRDAIAHLDTSVKESARLAFMAKIVADFHRPYP
jgi:glycosyltransferase involved in cell wall biosynthesis